MKVITKENLLAKGFELKTYSDGKFWIRQVNEDSFYQIDENLENATYYDDGNVWELSEEEFTESNKLGEIK